MGGLTALDVFKLLTCLHMHRAPSPSLYTACAAALAPKLGELQYACTARVQGSGFRVQGPGFRVQGFQLEGRRYGGHVWGLLPWVGRLTSSGSSMRQSALVTFGVRASQAW